MMTKDLSRQLCELAGIETHELCNDCTDDNGNPITDPENDCKFYPCGNPCHRVYYPNFESPENFVKLLEVYLNTSNDYISFDTGFDKFECTAGGYTNKYGELYGEVMNYSESLEEATIMTIIGYLKKEKTNKLKQALQATDWRY